MLDDHNETDFGPMTPTTQLSEEMAALETQEQPRSYFPKLTARIHTRSLPDRPDTVGPILDPEHAGEPLPEFDIDAYHQNYTNPSPTGLAIAPGRPEGWEDAYLVPSLARDERRRLTILWYYTRMIEQDRDLLLRLDTIVSTVQETTGWEFALVGILDEAIYTRLATTNLPIALLPRRESTCSHTILQHPGSVFMSTNMADDWRFRESPHVKIGGLRSYAGTQLLAMTEDGDEVVLGSLCVASNSTQPPLTQKQRAMLVRFADIVSWEITNRARQLRYNERTAMTESLLKLERDASQPNFKSTIIAAVQQRYPDAHISFQDSVDGTLELQGRDAIRCSEIVQNLWEDTDLIDGNIKTCNYQRLKTNQTVRVISARCGVTNFYLVIASTDIRYVFDDVDAWYVEQCANLFADFLQKQLLSQALDAKESFLRNITHQLRTPIHGILASVDLISEEINSHGPLLFQNNDMTFDEDKAPLTAYITAIRSSGRELMSTVNNILRFNTLTTEPQMEKVGRVKYDLRGLGPEVIAEALRLVPEEQMRAVSVQVRNKLTHEQDMIMLDHRWLKECIQPLVLNGLQSVLGTGCGVVTMIVSYNEDTETLWFDFKDTGVGIKAADRKRIFSAFEKVDDHKAGAGLGLTLARQIAEKHNGTISLVASLEGYGSHFRATFSQQKLSAALNRLSDTNEAPECLPRVFHKAFSSSNHSHMLEHLHDHLVNIGFEQRGRLESELIITDSPITTEFLDDLRMKGMKRVVIVHYQDSEPQERIQKLSGHLAILHVTGPFYGARLITIVHQADLLYGQMQSLSSSTSTSPPLTLSSPDLPSPPEQGVPNNQNWAVNALLVDDNAINLRILEMFCRKRKISYVTAQDGLKAEAEFRKALKSSRPINLVLMDLQMPLCDGVQATRAIRAIEKDHDLTRCSIFMVTGQDSPRDKTQSEEAGADEFLVKPVALKLLHEHIIKYHGDIVCQR